MSEFDTPFAPAVCKRGAKTPQTATGTAALLLACYFPAVVVVNSYTEPKERTPPAAVVPNRLPDASRSRGLSARRPSPNVYST